MSARMDGEVMSDINVTPLVDIMLVLLIVFIITAPVIHQAFKLNLPKAENTQSIHKKEILLSVNKELHYFVNNKQIAFEMLRPTLQNEISKAPEALVVVRCDNSLTVQQLVNVLEIGNSLNVKMILATKKE